MGNDQFVVKKRSTWLSVIKAILIIAAIAFVAYKIYDKFFRKKVQQDVLSDADDALADLPEADDGIESSVQDVIADAE
ncbi:MAG: hypothetical protein IKC59_00670 [Clostridia bacterium]|nr:hypothetical protein [Clostridia bacterium]